MSHQIFLVALLLVPVTDDEISRTHVIGDASDDSETVIARQVAFTTWVDESTIIYAKKTGEVTCYDLASNQEIWSIKDAGPVRSLSASRETNRVAILLDTSQFGRNDTIVRVLDARTGDDIFTASSNDIAKLADKPFVVISQLAISPANGQLLLVNFSSTYGENAFLLNATYDRIVSRVLIDGVIKEVGISEDGTTMTTFGANDTVCVNTMTMNEELFQSGHRILDESDVQPITSDVPAMSGARFDGNRNVVYAIDNPFAAGHLLVENIELGEKHAIPTDNAHIVMDLDAKHGRIAVSGTSTNLAIVTIEGDQIGHFEAASTQRVNCVQFSPSGKQVLAGGADGTVTVFRLEME